MTCDIEPSCLSCWRRREHCEVGRDTCAASVSKVRSALSCRKRNCQLECNDCYMSTRKQEWLDGALAYLVEHGVASLSLRRTHGHAVRPWRPRSAPSPYSTDCSSSS